MPRCWFSLQACMPGRHTGTSQGQACVSHEKTWKNTAQRVISSAPQFSLLALLFPHVCWCLKPRGKNCLHEAAGRWGWAVCLCVSIHPSSLLGDVFGSPLCPFLQLGEQHHVFTIPQPRPGAASLAPAASCYFHPAVIGGDR